MSKFGWIIFAFLFISCESQIHINIQCLDATTKLPLQEVKVNINAGLNGDYNKSTSEGFTDEEGNFSTSIMIGCPGKCYDIYVTCSKDGYENVKELNRTEGVYYLSPD